MLEQIEDKIYMLKGTKSSNIYYLDFKEKALIDTGHHDDFEKNQKIFEENGLSFSKLNYIINTHSHGDHVGGNHNFNKINSNIKFIGSKFTKVYQNKRNSLSLLKGIEDDFIEYDLDCVVNEGDRIDLGGCILDVVDTPGHTIDSLSYYFGEKKILFSGDTIYYKVITQLDFYQDLLKSHNELYITYMKISNLDCKKIMVGHGNPIFDIKGTLNSCFKKLDIFKKNPEMIIINNLNPSMQYYIQKQPGCNIEEIRNYFIDRLLKFDNKAKFIDIDPAKYPEIVDKTLSLMLLLDIIKEKNDTIILTNKINENIGIKKQEIKM